jgi:hypothetical protein
MPLEPGAGEATIQHNIREMRAAGHPEAQAVAAAEREAHDVALDGDRLDAVLTAIDGLSKRMDAMARARA